MVSGFKEKLDMSIIAISARTITVTGDDGLYYSRGKQAGAGANCGVGRWWRETSLRVRANSWSKVTGMKAIICRGVTS